MKNPPLYVNLACVQSEKRQRKNDLPSQKSPGMCVLAVPKKSHWLCVFDNFLGGCTNFIKLKKKGNIGNKGSLVHMKKDVGLF